MQCYSDSETDSSDTEEDSDTETLDNSSRTASYEDCSADVLEWKGFEVVRDARIGQSGKSNVSTTGKVDDISRPCLNYLITCINSNNVS